MLGLMQDHPLLISTIFEHAVKNYSKQEIVSILLKVVSINILILTGEKEQRN